MIVEAIKDGDRYILPLKGKKDKIRLFLDEEMEDFDIRSLFETSVKRDDFEYKELSKDDFREFYGDELYRQYLLIDKKTMEDEWQYLVTTEKDWGDDFEEMEEAIAYWNKEG